MPPPATGPFICDIVSIKKRCTQMLALPSNVTMYQRDLLTDRALHSINRRMQATVGSGHQVVALARGGHKVKWLQPGVPDTSFPAYVYNPSILDEDNMLLRISSFSMCSMNESATANDVKRSFKAVGAVPLSLTVWLNDEQARGIIRNSEDARPIRLHGRVHAIFKRVYSPRLKRMWLAQLEPSYREVMLSFREQRRIEMNWSPFVINETLYLSYTLCPHTVLRCDPLSGACEKAFSSIPRGGCPGYQGADGKGRTPSAMHGGSQLVHVRDGAADRLLGAAHFKLYAPVKGQHALPWWYLHVFYTLDTAPPFALRGVSRPFILPGAFGDPFKDRVQFGAGLAPVASGRATGADRFVLTYGLGDCVAMAVSLPRQFVLEEAAWEGWVRFKPNQTHLGTW